MFKGLDIALQQVNEFHDKFGVSRNMSPTMMGEELANNRYKFSKEECDELVEADNIYKQVDSALDRIYLALGDLSIMGIKNVQTLFDMVQESNMGKVWPDGKVHRDPETGKIIKPPGWIENWDHEPRLMAEIDRQISESNNDVFVRGEVEPQSIEISVKVKPGEDPLPEPQSVEEKSPHTYRLELMETLKYQREMVIVLPEEKTDKELNSMLDSAEKQSESAFDVAHYLERHYDIKVTEYPDQDLNSPYSAEVEIEDFDKE